jgi:hypothetical protein
MALTNAQLLALKAAIQANTDPEFVGYRDAGMARPMADWYNVSASPAFVVWKTRVSNDEIGDAMNGTEVAGLSSLNMQRAQMLANYSSGYQNPSRADRRAAFDAIFSGAGGQNTRAALAILWRRTATRAEKLFASGTGTDAAPATLSFEGSLSDYDIALALSAG